MQNKPPRITPIQQEQEQKQKPTTPPSPHAKERTMEKTEGFTNTPRNGVKHLKCKQNKEREKQHHERDFLESFVKS